MKTQFNFFKTSLAVTVLLFAFSFANAVTVTVSTTPINWSAITGGSGPGGLPSSADNVIINQGVTVTVNVSDAVCASLQICNAASGTATLAFNSGSQLTVSGTVMLGGTTNPRIGVINMTNGGTLICNALDIGASSSNMFTYGTGTVQLNATNTIPSSIFTQFNNLIVYGGTTTLPNANLTCARVTVDNSGTLQYNSGNSRTLTVSGNVDLVSGTINTANASGTNNNILTIGGNLTMSSGTALSTVNGNDVIAINIAGNWTDNGVTFTPGTNTVTFNGTGAQAINGTAASQTFYDVTIGKTAGTLLSVGGSTTFVTVNNLTETTGNFTAPTTLSINGGLTISAGTFTGGTTINILGDWTNNGGTFTPGSSTVNFNNTAAGQSIGGSVAIRTFNNITVAKTAQTLSTGTSITTLNLNTLTLTSGIFNPHTNLVNVNVSGDWINNGGSFTPTSTVINFNNTSAAQSISGIATSQTFNNVTVAKSAQTLTVGGSTTTLSLVNLSLTSGTLDAGTAATINVSGDWTNNSGTSAFIAGSSEVKFTNPTSDNIGGSFLTNFNNISTNAASATTLNINTSINATNVTFTTTGITLSVAIGKLLNISGALTMNSLDATMSCTISGAGSLTCGSMAVGTVSVPTSNRSTTLTSSISSITVTNNLTITSSRSGTSNNNANFAQSSGTLTVGGTITPVTTSNAACIATISLGNGSPTLILTGTNPFGTTGNLGLFIKTLTGTNSTVVYSGGSQAVLGTAYNNLTISGIGTKTLASLSISGGSKLSMQGTAICTGVSPSYLNDNTSSLVYEGSSGAQTTGAELPSVMNALVIVNNSAGVTLNASTTFINVSGSVTALTLLAGNLTTTASKLLTMTASVGLSGSTNIVGSSSSYINGPLKVYFSTSSNFASSTYNWPIGKGSYTPWALSNMTKLSGGTNDMYVQVEVFDANSLGSASSAKYSRVSAINNNRYWEATVTNPGVFTSANVSLTETSLAVNADSRVAFCATQSGIYDGLKGITLAGNTITSIGLANSLKYFTVGTTSYLTTGTYTVGDSRTYLNLTDIVKILDTKTLSGNVIFELQNDYDGTVANVTNPEVIPITFVPFLTSGGSWTATIRPASGVSMRTTSAPQITGGATQSIIFLDSQVQNITFDGRAGGTGGTIGWTIRNTSTSGNVGSAIQFTNGAIFNTLKYLQVEGESNGTNQGVIIFGNSTVTGGSSNNAISNCKITDLTVGGTSSRPLNLIGCDGNGSGKENSINSILNNEIFNFSNCGIRLGGTGTGDGWTINGNSFYCTTSDPNTSTAINNLAGSTYGGYTINGNFIGGNGPNCGTVGAPWTITANNGDFIGIAMTTSKTNSSSIQNNVIQNILLQGTGTATFNGIQIFQGACNIAGNTIGSASTANSIVVSGTGRSVGVYSSASSSTAVVTINNNTIANFSSTNATSPEILSGIWTDNGTNFITNNTIFNLSAADNNTNAAIGGNGSKVSVVGISFTADQANETVIGNTIYNLSNTHSTAAVHVIGIYMSSGGVTNCTIARNFIHHLYTSSSSTSSQITGISMYNGGDVYKNNMISIGTNLPVGANPVIVGIDAVYGNASSSFFYNNSVYIGGTVTPTGTANSFCFRRLNHSSSSVPAHTVQDNIFVNERSNATTGGKHFAIGLNNSTTTFTSNYNIYNATGTGGAIATLNSGSTSLTLQGFKATLINGVSHDINSGEGDPNFINSTGNAASVDLHLQSPTPAEATGLLIASVTDDFDGQTRSGFTPTDIGADAGIFTPLDIYAPVITYIAIAAQNTCTNLTLTATITDVGTGVPVTGINVPRIYFRRSSPASATWENLPGTKISGDGNNGTWNFIIDYSLLSITNLAGGTYQYYVVAQDQAANPIDPNIGFSAFNTTTPVFTNNNVNTNATQNGAPSSYIINSAAGPTAYSVTPSSSCGSAVISVSNSQTGVSYNLKLTDPVAGAIADGPLSGNTGNSISFASQAPLATSTYYVVGTNANSCPQTMSNTAIINFLPAAPVAVAGSNPTDVLIRANWGTVSGATNYFLDVSTVSDFSTFVTSTDLVTVYNNLSVGNVSFRNVTGLLYNTTYYYRVRSNNGICTSVSSNVIMMPTCGIRTWSGGTGDWFTTSNWTPPFVPNACDNVIINSGNSTVDGSLDAFCLDIAVNGGALTVASGYSGTMRVTGNLSNGAAINTNSNLISLQGGAGRTISGSGSFSNAGFSVNGNSTYTMLNSLTASPIGNLVVNVGSTFDMNDFNLKVSGITMTGSGIFRQRSGTLTITDLAATLTNNFNGGAGTTIFDRGDDQIVPSITTYNHLIIQGTIGKTVTVGSGANGGCNNLTIQGAGTVVTSNLFSTSVAGNFNLTGTVALSINHPIRGTGGSSSFSMTGNNTITITKDNIAAPAPANTARALSGFGTLSFLNNLTYNSNSDQYLLPGSYVNLSISGGTGNRNMSDGNVTVSNTLTVLAGIINTTVYEINLGTTGVLNELPTSFVFGKIKSTRNIAPTSSFGGLGIDVTQGVNSNGITCTRVIGTEIPVGCANGSILRRFEFIPNPAQNATVVFHYYDTPYELNGFVENYFIVYKSTDGGVTWSAQTGTVDAAANTVTMINQPGLGYYSATAPFPLGGIATPQSSIVCTGNSQTLTVTGAKGRSYEWQHSTNNVNWSIAPGISNTFSYQATPATAKVYYRFVAHAAECWDVSSNTVIVEQSPALPITIKVTGKTDNSVTINWSPVGTGNYDITYTGTGIPTSFISATTPPKTISGLVANGIYNITVTQSGVSGICSAGGDTLGVQTLCAMPTAVSATTQSNSSIKIDWTGPAGNYRVYYRNLFSQTSYVFKDVTTVTTSGSLTIGNLGSGGNYEFYVALKDCPGAGILGQPSELVYGRTSTSAPVTCTDVAVIDFVRSLCPVQIEVSMHGSLTNQYSVYLQRLTPTVGAVVGYTVTGGYLQVNIGAPGQTYLVAVAAKCASGSGELVIYPGGLEIKPLCNGASNLLLSHPTCKGFTASWNRDPCLEYTASYYAIYLRKQGSLSWNSYQVIPPIAPISPYFKVGFLGKGVIEEAYVRSIYNCTGYIALGPPSTIQAITTLSSGCRDEDEQDVTLIESEEPAVQITSPDNSEMLSLYPNPNSGQFRIDISRASASLSQTDDEVRIEVMNVVGQTILTYLSTIKDGHANDMINLPTTTASGTYFVRVTVGENVYTTKVNISK